MKWQSVQKGKRHKQILVQRTDIPELNIDSQAKQRNVVRLSQAREIL